MTGNAPQKPVVRTVEIAGETLTYTINRKRVKNLTLRVRGDGAVTLTVPLRCSLAQGDAMVRSRQAWIVSQREKLAAGRQPLPQEPPREECRQILEGALERVYPLVAPIGVERPQLRLRRMKSQWGNCHYRQGYITLNVVLARCPEGLQDYVALHELCHFLHHDHGPGFRRQMDGLMPDWRERRRALKGFSWALDGQPSGEVD